MDIVEFCEQVLGLELTVFQKEYLRFIQKHPNEIIAYPRGSSHSRYFMGWVYKKMYDEYCETGSINFLKPIDSDSFKREYECVWKEDSNEDN